MSGVAWPSMRLKHLCLRGPEYGLNESATSYAEDGVRFLRTTDITDRGELTSRDTAVFLPLALTSTAVLRDGDLLLSRSGTIGRSLEYREARHGPCSFAGYLVRFRPKRSVSSRYLFYFTKTQGFNDQIAADVIQTTIQNFNGQKFSGMTLPYPPPDEQRAIVDFLDEKTAAIDALIAKKERLIELLQEKRQAVITQAVTMGLDPNVPMKDSGIEWLGRVASHWQVAPLYARFSVQLGKMLDSSRDDGSGGFPYLRNANVSWEGIAIDDVKTMSLTAADRARYRLSAGDLLVCEGGANANVVGKSAIWRGQINECYYQKALHRLRARSDADLAEFLLYAMWCAFIRGAFVADANPNTVFHLTAEKLRSRRFAFPPLEEQRAIVEALQHRLAMLEQLTKKLETSTVALREYRQALISAAVTGKLDVTKALDRSASLEAP